MSEAAPLSALRAISERLRAHAKPFALVGGLAVTVRSEPRFTRDVDLCVAVRDDDEAEQLVFDLRNDGYEVAATVEHEERQRLSTVRLRDRVGVVCDLLVASSGIEHEVIERATMVEVVSGLTLPVAAVEELLTLKVLSSSSKRSQDRADIMRLIEYNPTFDRAAVLRNLELIAARGYHRGQDLRTKLEVLLASDQPTG